MPCLSRGHGSASASSLATQRPHTLGQPAGAPSQERAHSPGSPTSPSSKHSLDHKKEEAEKTGLAWGGGESGSCWECGETQHAQEEVCKKEQRMEGKSKEVGLGKKVVRQGHWVISPGDYSPVTSYAIAKRLPQGLPVNDI